MKYDISRDSHGADTIVVKEGPVFIGFIELGGSGFRIDEVRTGDTWYEGVGQEIVVIENSYEAAEKYIEMKYLNRK